MPRVGLVRFMKTRCPICGREVEIEKQQAGQGETGPVFFPFCSERCKLIDLGAWLDGRYKVVEEKSDREKKDSRD